MDEIFEREIAPFSWPATASAQWSKPTTAMYMIMIRDADEGPTFGASGGIRSHS